MIRHSVATESPGRIGASAGKMAKPVVDGLHQGKRRTVLTFEEVKVNQTLAPEEFTREALGKGARP